MRYLKITWRNTTDLGSIYYAGGFTNTIFLDVEVSKPEYPVEIEAEKDGENVSIPTFKKWQKAYKFALWATEDIVDAFTLMQIMDTITVTLQTGQQINVQNGGMTVGVEWMEGGCLAKLDVSFTEDYITGTNCDANLNDECYCATSGGNFEAIVAYPDSGAGYTEGEYILGYSIEDIAGKKYTAKLYVRTNQIGPGATIWIEQPTPAQFTCWENLDTSTTWIFDGQFWHLMPGYIIALTTLLTNITVSAYIPPGTFGNVYYSKNGGGSVLVGSYTDDELAAGITFAHTGAGTYDLWVTVWNHSCAYLNTESGQVIVT